MSVTNFMAFISLGLLSYASFRFSHLVYGDYFTPVGIFIGINLASLSLYQLNLLPLTPVSAQAYTLIAASLFSFLVGVLMASPSFVLTRKPLIRENLFSGCVKTPRGLSLFYYLTASFGIAGWIFYVTVIVPPGWLSNPWMLQGDYVFPYHLGYSLVSGALVLPTFVLLTLARRRVTLPSLCFLLGNVFALALCGIKTYLVIGLATSLLVWSAACPGRIRMKHLAIAAICLIGFMALYDRFIDVFVIHKFPGSKFPAALSFLESPYIYIVGPWSAMSVVMANPPAQAHWGQVTLLPIWMLLGPGGLGIMERVPKYLPFVNIGASDFNTYSLIGEVYYDFGWLGSILVCFILGFVSTRLYIVARKRGNWILYLLSALFSYGLFISFFAYYYRDVLTFLVLYTLIVGRLSKKVSGALKRLAANVSDRQSAFREAVS
ncbi:hypothetical protein Desku_1746 [Desulfofundulus kuznetsovii DSM 6115]|uniref:Oligosaccharide repeat unit polymerase n=1 Tax=Desulfofundulus kuznetsovii (strain DSM 6115 / VKM B-1805 / 17) TaxID=760568 RepID=A0AAU8P9T8_DESK7|nr:hypothetical protein Desku_1746 [Desulfofundulus kuznetsovii DSM 6115]